MAQRQDLEDPGATFVRPHDLSNNRPFGRLDTLERSIPLSYSLRVARIIWEFLVVVLTHCPPPNIRSRAFCPPPTSVCESTLAPCTPAEVSWRISACFC